MVTVRLKNDQQINLNEEKAPGTQQLKQKSRNGISLILIGLVWVTCLSLNQALVLEGCTLGLDSSGEHARL